MYEIGKRKEEKPLGQQVKEIIDREKPEFVLLFMSESIDKRNMKFKAFCNVENRYENLSEASLDMLIKMARK